ncbi:hypothetical protein ASG35_15200 [Burkholderia sp. Leaf177]|nr:hypothetical protein ASG35_15200 [Burkholderia sp. Leaf177]
MLFKAASSRRTRRHDLQLRMHILRVVRFLAASKRLPELRRRLSIPPDTSKSTISKPPGLD